MTDPLETPEVPDTIPDTDPESFDWEAFHARREAAIVAQNQREAELTNTHWSPIGEAPVPLNPNPES